MKYLLFISLFSFTLLAQTLKPAKMYDHEVILTNYFRPLRNYALKLKQLYAFDKSLNKYTFYTENSLYSHFSIELNIINQNTYEILINSENFDLEIIRFYTESQSLFNLDDFLELKFVKSFSAMDYQVEIASKARIIQSFKQDNIRQTQYVLGPTGTRANLEEYQTSDFYESTFSYSCSQCTGDILRAQFTPEYERYFRSFEQIEVNDSDFFSRANRFYISGILRGIDQLISEKIENNSWPEVE
tara:strand:- start:19578 stop:20309 length:732 start_codon:yes stop_codon:yes gene_type:complete